MTKVKIKVNANENVAFVAYKMWHLTELTIEEEDKLLFPTYG